jgi:hypothetical protein
VNRRPKARPQADAAQPYEHTQVHQLRNGASVVEVTIITRHEGSEASIKGLLGCLDPVPYASIELARQHWEHLVDLGWEPSAV